MPKPKPGEEFSLTQLNAFQKCRYLWNLSYQRGIRPSRKTRPMALGSLVHIGLAKALSGGDPRQAILESVVTNEVPMPQDTPGEVFVVDVDVDTDGIKDDALDITSRAVQYLWDHGDWETVSIDDYPLVEVKLAVPIKQGWMVGVVDWVARERNTNTVWLIDHKTRQSMQPDEVEDYNIQMAVYQRLLWDFDVNAVGSITFQIRAAIPSLPRQNKDGSMSRADILTDWDTYKRCLVEAGLDPFDYRDMQTKLEAKEFFRMTKVYRSDPLVQSIWKSSVLDVLAEMDLCKRSYASGHKPSRNQHIPNCRLCSSRDWCQAELRNLDTDWLLASGQFVKEVK